MTGTFDLPAAQAALAPVHEALLAQARRDADTRVRSAEQDADAVLARASQQAHDAVSLAREEGEADSRTALARDLARSRRRARGLVLAAQRAAYDDLLDACREAVRRLVDDPSWPIMQQGMLARAEELLGPGARALEEKDGLVVRAGDRLVDLGLGALAEEQVRALGPEVEKLWAT